MMSQKKQKKKKILKEVDKTVRNIETQENDVKLQQKVCQNDIKTVAKNTRISLSLDDHLLEDFIDISSYWGYSKSSAIVEAIRRFMIEMKRKKIVRERNVGMREKDGFH